jgi:hypothetical protein
MSIVLYEIRKALSSPVILALLAVFIGFNGFLIYEHDDFKRDLEKVNFLAGKYGTEINNPMLGEMKRDYEEQMVRVNNSTLDVLSSQYEDMNALYADNAYTLEEQFNKGELEFFADTALLELYYSTSLHVDDSFAAIDPIAIAEYEIHKYGMTGSAAQWIRKHYDEFTARYEQVKANKEYKHLFPAQSVFGTHLLLFKKMFKSFLLESVILSVLITSYVMNFEFDRKTYLLTYSTKRGRRLWLDKLLASLMASLGVFTAILGSGLAMYFSVFSYREFWHVPISSFFNSGKEWFMSWWNLSFLEYLGLAVALSYVLMLLFTLMTVVLARWVRNSYLVFFLFLCLFGVVFAAQGMLPRSHFTFLLGYFNPVNLVLNSFIWFMQRAVTFTPYFEAVTVGVWLILLTAAVLYCGKSFRRCDLK